MRACAEPQLKALEGTESLRRGNVGLGSKAVLSASERHFWSSPNNGHCQISPAGPFRANNRLRRRRVKAVRQQNLYKILPFRRMARDMPFFHAHPRRGLPFQQRHVLSLRRSFQTRPRHPTKWQGFDPVGYESPLRAPLQGYEQNELARLRSTRNARIRSERKAHHWEMIALVSWRYQLPQNGIRRQA